MPLTATEVRPNSTVYLCADTGMDYNNSIWWDKYAYQMGDYETQGYWHHVKGLWFKAHACCSGFWYLNMTRADRGYCDVGRTPLQNITPKGEAGLHSEVDDQIEGTLIPFADVLLGRCDYIYFTNGFNEDVSRQYFGFITQIENININVARVHFVLDAIQTYGEYFNFAPSVISRDMQHVERAYNLVPNPAGMNFHPEPFVPSEQDYIFQRIAGDQEIIQKSVFGKYSKLMVLTDISLARADITPNTYYGGLPSFKMSNTSMEDGVSLGTGVYYIPSRKCQTLDLLGSYNAVEHLLYCYMIPDNLGYAIPGSTEPVFVADTNSALPPEYKGDQHYTLLTPIKFNDDVQTTADADGYAPINLKCYYSPTSYVSITDNQGGSVEIEPQNLRAHEQSESNYFNLDVIMALSIAPNVGSAMYIQNNDDMDGGLGDPFVTLWQMPSYAMTPNNSGYNQDYVNAAYYKNTALKTVAIGSLAGLGSIALGAVPSILGISGELIGGLAGFSRSAGEGMIQGGISGGLSRIQHSIEERDTARMKEAFGLPKAVGGLAQGFTRFNMKNTGYSYYFVHQRTDLIKCLDVMFSIFGYQQGEFRYPHINTRRRWTYVQSPNINIIGKGHKSDVPMWAREQIKARLSAGVTFWNVRWGLFGDGDEGADPRSITSYDDGRIQAIKGHRFVGNYGDLGTQEYLKENMSTVGGYCADYTDNIPLPEPD